VVDALLGMVNIDVLLFHRNIKQNHHLHVPLLLAGRGQCPEGYGNADVITIVNALAQAETPTPG
jgi:RAB protein geranylgeranyltransferase component A